MKGMTVRGLAPHLAQGCWEDYVNICLYTQGFGVLVGSFNRKVAKTLGLTIAPEVLSQANRLVR
jgi:hypothetical protein